MDHNANEANGGTIARIVAEKGIQTRFSGFR
jgi:hypothetical protein